jgi:hypothetical protein
MNRPHPVVSTSLRGKDAEWNLATVIGGEYAGEQVCILVEFSDGWCICDRGDGKSVEVISIKDMRLWKSVLPTRCSNNTYAEARGEGSVFRRAINRLMKLDPE